MICVFFLPSTGNSIAHVGIVLARHPYVWTCRGSTQLDNTVHVHVVCVYALFAIMYYNMHD